MECNRDEANRAKSIAESKLEQKDYVGAQKFALKAQTLYPGLDGISQLLAMLDVYISAENKINGEVDWYGVLGVNPSADDETLKKQYRKLALALHPDKNKFIGADGAFKLISEAWSLLSDKVKRLAYNQRRSFKGFEQNVPTYTAGPSAAPPPPPPPPMENPFFTFMSRSPPAPKPKNRSGKAPTRTPTYAHGPSSTPTPTPPPPPSYQRPDTFWTICQRCKMQYEYLKVYLNHTLLCPNCHQPFMATQTAPPVNFRKSPKPVPWKRQHGLNDLLPNDYLPRPNIYAPGRKFAAAQKSGAGQAGPSSHRHANYQQSPLSGTANTVSTDPSAAAKAANLVQQAQETLKRTHTESYASAWWDGISKKRKLEDGSSQFGMNSNMAQGNSGFGTSSASGSRMYGFPGSGSGTASASGSRTYGFPGTYPQPNSTREMTPIEVRKMLMEKAQREILKTLSKPMMETTANAAGKEKQKANESNKERYRNNSNVQGHRVDGSSELSVTKMAEQAEKRRAGRSADDPSAEQGEKRQACHSADNKIEEYPTAVTMSVPDPDFHDFDRDRTEDSFADNEVWAAYDDDDGMPRFYVLISKVISRDPFKLRIGWLNSKNNSEFSTADWVGSGFYKTSGEFRVGRYETCEAVNAFSQRVSWSKGPRGSVLILPQKDDVWALYTNWSYDWNVHTPDEVVHKYDMVMVLGDYSEEQGVSVAPLEKVVGFKTVFRPNLDSDVIKRIPKEEMFRFSHLVPHHLLTSQEAPNVPNGCVELDPAATPLELLQMITEKNEIPVGADADSTQTVPVTNLDKIADETSEPQAVNIDSHEAN
ncbi:Chaperone protein DnaJ [Sesamum alatum]|uniref:Chaperone protein DnaJ n=1 Tax=Sesamum alatum TaxID=300844 RepID=A0AAE2CVR7_9LAMI|nr:Chaperone protein DnaJ [Sesamum alatum]